MICTKKCNNIKHTYCLYSLWQPEGTISHYILLVLKTKNICCTLNEPTAKQLKNASLCKCKDGLNKWNLIPSSSVSVWNLHVKYCLYLCVTRLSGWKVSASKKTDFNFQVRKDGIFSWLLFFSSYFQMICFSSCNPTECVHLKNVFQPFISFSQCVGINTND